MRAFAPLLTVLLVAAAPTAAAQTADMPTTSASTTAAASPVKSWTLLAKSATRTLAPGIQEYTEDYQAPEGHQHATLIEADLAAAGVRSDVVQANDVAYHAPDETLSSMANRTHAIAGVNGDYFAIHATGNPLGGAITHGVVVKSPRENYQAQLSVDAFGRAHVGAVSEKGSVSTVDGANFALNNRNSAAKDAITTVTNRFGSAKIAGTEVVGRALPGGLVKVTSVKDVSTVDSVHSGQLGLFGQGKGAEWLRAHAKPGSLLLTRQSLPGHYFDRALISGATVLVRDGATYTDPTGTPPSGVNPETMIGVRDGGRRILLVTIDGRAGAEKAVGVSPAQAGEFLVEHHSEDGLLLDGGGSTEMVGRDKKANTVSVLNTPSDGRERPVANGFFLYSR